MEQRRSGEASLLESAETQRIAKEEENQRQCRRSKPNGGGREDMKNVQEPHGVFVCCGCVVVEGL